MTISIFYATTSFGFGASEIPKSNTIFRRCFAHSIGTKVPLSTASIRGPAVGRADPLGFALARIRSHKPEFYEDLTVAEVCIEARYLYQAMWCWMDKGGIAEADPRLWKQRVFPYDSHVQVEQVWTWMVALISIGRLQCYYGASRVSAPVKPDPSMVLVRCPTFPKHQHFHKNETIKFNIPAADWCKHGASTVQAPEAPEQHRTARLDIGNLRSEIGNRGMVISSTTPAPDGSVAGAIATTITADVAQGRYVVYRTCLSRVRGIELPLIATPIALTQLKRLIGNCGGDIAVTDRVITGYVESNHEWWAKKKWSLEVLSDDRDFSYAYQIAHVLDRDSARSKSLDPFAKFREQS